MKRLPYSFYIQEDALLIAESLIGKVLATCIGGKVTKGVITETEAYCGINDKASHAYGNRRTKRTEIMYSQGGCAYIYLCYGIHHLFNVVTNKAGIPHAVLIRNILPLEGVDVMIERRKNAKTLLSGPGTLTQALGITTALNGFDLSGDTVWIEDTISQGEIEIVTTPRIGVDYAGEDASLPYRFVLRQVP